MFTRCTDTVFNIRILSVSVKNYPYPYPIRSDVVNCYPYPIHIHGSIMVQLHCESQKISPDIFDCSFNIGCQILIVFWHRYTRFNTASNDGFSFPTSPNSFFCPTRERDKYKNCMPVARGARGFDGFDRTPLSRNLDRPWWQ